MSFKLGSTGVNERLVVGKSDSKSAAWWMAVLQPEQLSPRTVHHRAATVGTKKYLYDISSDNAYCNACLRHAGRYTLHPSGMAEFLKLSADTAELRGKLLPFLG